MAALGEAEGRSGRAGRRPRQERPGTAGGRPGGGGAAAALALLALAWAPLPLGSNRPWSWSLLACLVALALTALCAGRRQEGAAARPAPAPAPAPLRVAALLVALAGAWAAAQALPAPHPALAHPIWSAVAGQDLGDAVTPAVSLDPHATRAALLRLLTYGGAFWLGYALGADPARAERTLAALVAVGAAYALWGLARRGAGIGHVFWNLPGDPGHVSSTFPNRNHFATYANVLLLVALARLAAPALEGGGGRPWRAVLAEAAARVFERHAGLFLAAVTLLLATLLTGSRGGAISLGAGVAALVVLASARRRRPGRALALAAAAAALAGVGLFQAAGGALAPRFALLERQVADDLRLEGEGRPSAWAVTLGLVAERPLLGHGYGTFEAAFRTARDERFRTVYDHAHNTYLQHAAELGVPAAAALHGGLLLAFLACCRGALRRRPPDACAPLGAAAATVAVACHATVDFGAEIPAVAATYAFVLGAGCARAA